jgi:hypothetical protein
MEPAKDRGTNLVEAEATVPVEERPSLEDSDHADVLCPGLVRPQHDPIVGRQSLQAHRSHRRFLRLLPASVR